MTNGNSSDRLDRVEKIIADMAARQQYHDEAFERQDAAIRDLRAAIEIDAENIRALARIAEAHERPWDGLDGR
jgi:phage shock protein A